MNNPSDYQKALIERLLSRDFPEVEALREQLVSYRVEDWQCEDSCGSFGIHPDKQTRSANIDQGIPVEGLAINSDGYPVEYLLHVVDGYVSDLEVVTYTDTPMHNNIPLDNIKVLTYDERIDYEASGR